MRKSASTRKNLFSVMNVASPIRILKGKGTLHSCGARYVEQSTQSNQGSSCLVFNGQMIYVKAHTSRYWRKTVGLCDEAILGKEFIEGKKCLKVHPEFYGGHKVSEKEALRHAKEGYMVNAVGKEAIHVLMEGKIITQQDIQYIEGIPYAQVLHEL